MTGFPSTTPPQDVNAPDPTPTDEPAPTPEDQPSDPVTAPELASSGSSVVDRLDAIEAFIAKQLGYVPNEPA